MISLKMMRILMTAKLKKKMNKNLPALFQGGYILILSLNLDL